MKLLPLCLLFVAALNAQTVCAIRGAAVDAFTGKPIPRARVFAEQESAPSVQRITDAQGTFCFERLKAGDYGLKARRFLYLDSEDGPEIHVDPSSPAPPIIIKLTPQSTISGVLLDPDGDPVQGATVELLRRKWKQGQPTAMRVQQTGTDDLGRYRFASLGAGTYFMRSRPTPRYGDAIRARPLDQNRQPMRQIVSGVWYGGSFSFRDATPIRLGVGQEISNLTLSFRTAETRHIGGHVKPAASPLPQSISLLRDGESLGFFIPIQPGGHFLTEGLTPDRYTVRGANLRDAEVDLTANDMDDLVLEPDDPVELQITVHLEGTNPPAGALLLADKTLGTKPAQRISENKFRLTVGAGHYEIGFGDGAPTYFTKGLIVDGKLQPRHILDLQSGGQRSVDLYLTSNLARVEGRVTLDRPGANDITLLVEDESELDSLRTKQIKADGTFQLTFLHRARYRLYAFEEFNKDSWGNPELAALLAAKSIVVDVKEGQRSRVSLPLISTEEFNAALKKTDF
jgi:hypothetical protein